MAEVATKMSEAARICLGFGFFVVVILMGAAAFGVLSIGRPIRHIAGILQQLANGSREFEIPYTQRGDEVGDAARAARRLSATISCGWKSSRPNRKRRASA